MFIKYALYSIFMLVLSGAVATVGWLIGSKLRKTK